MASDEARLIGLKLAEGVEPFLVWADVVGKDQVKEMLSKHASTILQALANLNFKKDRPDYPIKDCMAEVLDTLGTLCLKFNMLTHSATKACLEVALFDLSSRSKYSIRLELEDSSTIRFYQALGIFIAKCAARLKYSKSYVDADVESEAKVANKLKTL